MTSEGMVKRKTTLALLSDGAIFLLQMSNNERGLKVDSGKLKQDLWESRGLILWLTDKIVSSRCGDVKL